MKHLKTFENHSNIEVTQSGGLQCDNPNCDWSDMTIPVSEYDKWVNKGCPKCGECVLTEDDFNKTNQLMSAINMINSMSPEQLDELSKHMDSDDIIDAYLKLKAFGFKHEGDDNWRVDFNKNQE